jgi:Arc/MetJ-type ribon-helix-helix transcriptional regulator
MVRTQIQLTEEQSDALKALAAAEGRSVADLVRTAVDALLGSRARLDRAALRRQAIELAGRFRSGTPDLGAEHDRHLGEAFRR